MKKFSLIVVLISSLFILVSCDSYDISKILFIASVGIEKQEDQYIGYFYLPLSSDIGKNDTAENKGQGEFAKTKGESISDLFYNIQAATSLSINFRHVSSIVIHTELLNKDFLEELFDYIKYSLSIDFNFYIFATKSKMNDLFSFKNPNQESVLNSLLVSTSDSTSLFLVAPPMHFLEFVRKYYLDRSLLLPLLEVEEIWTIEGEEVKNFHCQSAIYYHKDKTKEVTKDPRSPYINTLSEFVDKINDTTICFKDYTCKPKYEDEAYLSISFSYTYYKTDVTISREDILLFVKNNLLEYIEKYKESDPFDLNYFSRLNQKSYSYDSMKIEVKIENN
jgi:hypothetical protein